MKAESGSLVYIIISIALLIISSLGKKKKQVNPPTTDYEPDYDQHPQAPRPQQTSEWPKDLEDVFGKMFDVETPKPAEKPYSYEEEYKPETTYSSYENYIPENESLEIIKEESDSLEILKPNEADYVVGKKYEFESEMEYDLDLEEPAFAIDEIEVEKAVVYAEIINRKYF